MGKNTEYVRCSICGRKFAGKIPKGGDGSVLFPRKHSIMLITMRSAISGREFKRKTVCDGSYQAGELL